MNLADEMREQAKSKSDENFKKKVEDDFNFFLWKIKLAANEGKTSYRIFASEDIYIFPKLTGDTGDEVRKKLFEKGFNVYEELSPIAWVIDWSIENE